MTYPRNLRRLSACEMVRIFSFFTGRDSRKPSGVYGFKSVVCEYMPDSGQNHTTDGNDGFLVTTACFNALITCNKFRMFLRFD